GRRRRRLHPDDGGRGRVQPVPGPQCGRHRGAGDLTIKVTSEGGLLCKPSKKTSFGRSEEHTSELQSRFEVVCRLLLEKKKTEVTPDRRRSRPRPIHCGARSPRAAPTVPRCCAGCADRGKMSRRARGSCARQTDRCPST